MAIYQENFGSVSLCGVGLQSVRWGLLVLVAVL
jgi:hypothetical protein